MLFPHLLCSSPQDLRFGEVSSWAGLSLHPHAFECIPDNCQGLTAQLSNKAEGNYPGKLQHHPTPSPALSTQTSHGFTLLDSNVARVPHGDALGCAALLHHCSKAEVLLVQADTDPLAGALQHEQGAQQPAALQHHFFSERLNAALWGEDHLHFTGVSFGLQT